MERWAANTLRTLGIILLAGFILVVSLVLLLLSLCAWQGGFGGGSRPDEGLAYLIAAVVLLGGGIWVIARQSRSLMRSVAAKGQDVSPLGEAGAASSGPILDSPESLRAVRLLAQAMGAQIVLSVLGVVWSYSTMTASVALVNWKLILLAPFALYHLPYAILIYKLLQGANRWTFAYSLAVPSILLFQSVFSLSIVASVYVRHPAGLLLVLVPWVLHILILVLAYKAIQRVGLHPEPPLLARAAVVTFGYFFVVHLAVPLLLFRLARR